LETSARLLRLLSLLQQRRDWTGPALAERLGVTTRTIRNDIERLRTLGYPVPATPGAAGGYRLGAGAALPPLLLDDEEAVAVAVGLRTAADGSVSGIEETSLRALAKLEQVLPARLRHRVDAVHSVTVAVPRSGPTVDARVLAELARVCRSLERLRFDYVGHDGASSVRTVEPHRLVHTTGRWYLVAWDVDRSDWRTFRVDRIRPRVPTGPRFTARPLPHGGDVAAFVAAGRQAATWKHRARIRLFAPAASVAARLPWAAEVVPVDDETCEVVVGSDTYGLLAHYIGLLGVDFEVLDSDELRARVASLAQRYARAIAATSPK
jgi:predicted DNA-binding transcriptional regulator YafY